MRRTPRRPSIVVFLGVFLATVAGSLSAATAEPAGPAAVPRSAVTAVALLSERYVGEDDEYHYQLWTEAPDGTRRAVLTDPFTKPFAADVSPDGRRVAFTVGAGSTLPSSGLFVVGVDGHGRTDLLAGSTRINTAREPDWSPDGRSLVFAAVDSDLRYDLWRVGADGTGLVRLTSCGCAAFNAPAWSPDGTRVLWMPDMYSLAVLDVATGESTLIYDHTPSGHVSVQDADWSPDGSTIVFSASEPYPAVTQVLWTIPATGGQPTVHTRLEGASLSSPHFTPDGASIGVTATPTDGSGPDRVVTVPAAGGGPAQPYGDSPLFRDLLGWGTDCACAPSGRASSLTVRVRTMSAGLEVAGGLLPGLAGQLVKVVVQRSSDGRRWKPLQTQVVTTSSQATYFASTARAAGRTCRVTVTWAGDADHDPAKVRTKPLAC